MIAKPSIAFNDFAGTAKEVTARNVNGRNVLSVRAKQSKVVTPAQAASRNQLSKISREYKQLSDSQMQAWEVLATHLKTVSYFGATAEMTGHNAYVRLNSNRQMAGLESISDAPSHIHNIPAVSYEEIWITPKTLIIKGIEHQAEPLKLVIKMSVAQSAGVTAGWDKTVIVSPGMEDDWGDADMTMLYMKTIGVVPQVGQKIFIEMYWMDTDTGFTGAVSREVRICETESQAEEEGYVPRTKLTMADVVEAESHVSTYDVDYSTNSPVIYFDTVCLGHSNVASSEVLLEEALDTALMGNSIAIGRGMGEDGNLKPQSYLVYMNTWRGQTTMTFAHRGGAYVKPTEVFGPGPLFNS